MTSYYNYITFNSTSIKLYKEYEYPKTKKTRIKRKRNSNKF